MPRLKIRRLWIAGYQQFRDVEIDFTNPQTGEAADRICFLGRNGTGKSTLLERIYAMLSALPQPANFGEATAIELETHAHRFVLWAGAIDRTPRYFRTDITHREGWFGRLARTENVRAFHQLLATELADSYIQGDELEAVHASLLFQHNGNDLLALAKAEDSQNKYLKLTDVPNTNLSDALAFQSGIPFQHVVSSGHVEQMWKLLIYLVKKREADREAFERAPQNLDRTKRELLDEFNREHPEILLELATVWNRILASADLEFDVEGASIPVQLNENLRAYIRHKGSKKRIAYNQLSTGMRNFMFRIGHIYLLYFNRQIERGFLLIDEPENSLFPDFLFDLMETYDEIVRNPGGTTGTQMFVATHNLIVAAQFAPHERIVLEWKSEGKVTAKKGIAPEGDDPNDLLQKDFGLTHLMGRKGQEMWEEYRRIRKQIRRTKDDEEKKKLVEEALRIGRNYDFD